MHLMNKTLIAAIAASALGSANAATILSFSNWSGQLDLNEGGGSLDWFGTSSTGGPGAGSDPDITGSGLLRGGGTFDSATALQLASGGFDSVEISYAFFARNTEVDGFNIQYSALGDFSDTVVLKTYNSFVANTGGPAPVVAGEPYELSRWYAGESITLTAETSADADPLTVVFTDTAKIRFKNGGTTNGHWSYIDDVTVTGIVPEPGSLALMGLGGLCVLRRRRS